MNDHNFKPDPDREGVFFINIESSKPKTCGKLLKIISNPPKLKGWKDYLNKHEGKNNDKK